MHRNVSRHGLTLLEVLIAIFVLSVGLLSAAALIPLGQSQVARAIRQDRVSNLGQSTLSLARARGFFRLNADGETMFMKAVDNDPSAPTWTAVFLAANASAPHLTAPVTGTDANYLGPIAIDPVALNPANVTSPMPNLDEQKPMLDRFPLIPSSATGPEPARIPRLTLRADPDAATPAPMTLAQASALFFSDDELTIDLPEDLQDVPANQRDDFGYALEDATDPTSARIRRLYDPRYSWAMTLQPDESGGGSQFRASLVIFRNRQLEDTSDDTDSLPDLNEYAVQASIPSSLFGGGLITLQVPDDPAEQDWLEEMPKDCWVMVMEHRVPVPASDPPFAEKIRWYRVTNVDDVRGTGPFTRDIYVAGPDWEFASSMTVTCGIFYDVVGVYEKVVTFEGASPWTQSN